MTVETNPCVRFSRQTHRINHTTIKISNIRSTKNINYIIFIIFIVEAMFPILPMRCCVSSVCGLAFKQSSTHIAGSSSFRKRALAQSLPIRIKSPPSSSSITPTVVVTPSVVTTTPITTTTATSPTTTSTEPAQQITATMVKKTSNTGGLRRLPMVKPPADLISSARKSLYKVKVDSEMKNIRLRIRKYGSETINTLMIALCVPLRDIVDGYKREWKRLHPFERVVAD